MEISAGLYFENLQLIIVDLIFSKFKDTDFPKLQKNKMSMTSEEGQIRLISLDLPKIKGRIYYFQYNQTKTSYFPRMLILISKISQTYETLQIYPRTILRLMCEIHSQEQVTNKDFIIFLSQIKVVMIEKCEEQREGREGIIHYANDQLDETTLIQSCCAQGYINVFHISLIKNQKLKLFRPFSGLRFPKLCELLLERNAIESIECLSCIDLPCLKKMTLKRNLITNLSCLRRLNCRNIQEITIYQKFKENNCRKLSQLDMNGLKIMKLQCFNTRIIEEDCRWILKINAQKLKEISYCKSDGRIVQQRGKQIMQQKFLS